MKKITVIFIVVLLLQALCLPALAADSEGVFEVRESMSLNNGTYSGVHIMSGATLSVDGGGITVDKSLYINGILAVNGWLSGGTITGGEFTGTVVLGEHGQIELTFEDETLADGFLAIIESGVCVTKETENDGDIYVKVTKCTHSETETLLADVVVCEGCDQVLSYSPVGTEGGSTLSEGSLTIVVGIAAAVIFGLVGFLVGNKKKKAAKDAAGSMQNKE